MKTILVVALALAGCGDDAAGSDGAVPDLSVGTMDASR